MFITLEKANAPCYTKAYLKPAFCRILIFFLQVLRFSLQKERAGKLFINLIWLWSNGILTLDAY